MIYLLVFTRGHAHHENADAAGRCEGPRDAGDAALAAHLAKHVASVCASERGGTGRAEDFSLAQVGDVTPGLLIERDIVAAMGRC